MFSCTYARQQCKKDQRGKKGWQAHDYVTRRNKKNVHIIVFSCAAYKCWRASESKLPSPSSLSQFEYRTVRGMY